MVLHGHRTTTQIQTTEHFCFLSHILTLRKMDDCIQCLCDLPMMTWAYSRRSSCLNDNSKIRLMRYLHQDIECIYYDPVALFENNDNYLLALPEHIHYHIQTFLNINDKSSLGMSNRRMYYEQRYWQTNGYKTFSLVREFKGRSACMCGVKHDFFLKRHIEVYNLCSNFGRGLF